MPEDAVGKLASWVVARWLADLPAKVMAGKPACCKFGWGVRFEAICGFLVVA